MNYEVDWLAYFQIYNQSHLKNFHDENKHSINIQHDSC